MAADEQRQPGWLERRKAAKRAKAERTGDSREKETERSRDKADSTVRDSAGRAGVIGTLAG